MKTSVTIKRADAPLLTISVSRQASTAETLTGITAVGGVAAFLTYYFFGPLVGACAGAAAATTAFAVLSRSDTVTLKITRFDFVVNGWHTLGLPRSYSVPIADVAQLAYDEGSGGGDVAGSPEGLYAILRRGSKCILPFVDRQQCNEVIQEIEQSIAL